MKVLMVNGSPHPNGCTYTALEEVAKALNQQGIATEIFQLGTNPIAGCKACRSCAKTGKCTFSDCVNDFLELSKAADGFIFGSPYILRLPTARLLRLWIAFSIRTCVRAKKHFI